VIVVVDRNLQRSPCTASGGRSKRQIDRADFVHFNKSLLTAAMTIAQPTIESVRIAYVVGC